MPKWSRFLLTVALAWLGFGAVLYAWGAMLRPPLDTKPLVYSKEKLKEIETLRDVGFDAKNPPIIQRDVNYAQGKSAAWFPKGQSPILAELG